jgi:hypothetical protein
LRRPELELRAWLPIEVGKRGGVSVATYEGRLSVRCKATRRRGGGGFHQGVRLGHALEEEEDTAYTRARRGSDSEGGEKGAVAYASTGSARYATRERDRLRPERKKGCGCKVLDG